MPNSLSLSGKVGPNLTLPATIFTDVNSFNVDLVNQVVQVFRANGVVMSFDLYGVTTFTYTVASHLATILLS